MSVTLFVENVTILDYAYLRPDVRVAGDSLLLAVEVWGELNANGFIIDFGVLKPLLKRLVDRELDHKLLLPTHDPDLSVEEHEGRSVVRYGNLTYEAPSIAVARLDAATITHDAIARRIEALVGPHLPPNVTGLRAHLTRDARAEQQASFAYTHGLRQHDGNCQRLLHGHRGVFVAMLDGQRDRDLEGWLTRRFDGAHFAAARDVQGDMVAYRSPQGDFAVSLPPGRVVVLDAEPSIENVTQFAFAEVMRFFELEAGRLILRGYEGPQRGASVTLA